MLNEIVSRITEQIWSCSSLCFVPIFDGVVVKSTGVDINVLGFLKRVSFSFMCYLVFLCTSRFIGEKHHLLLESKNIHSTTLLTQFKERLHSCIRSETAGRVTGAHLERNVACDVFWLECCTVQREGFGNTFSQNKDFVETAYLDIECFLESVRCHVECLGMSRNNLLFCFLHILKPACTHKLHPDVLPCPLWSMLYFYTGTLGENPAQGGID